MKPTLGISLAVLVAARCTAGEFINLDFNSPDLLGPLVPYAPGGPYLGAASQLVRGWTVTADGKVVTDAMYSLVRQGSGSAMVTLQQEDASSGLGYSLTLASFPSNDGKSGPDVLLSQTGAIPNDAVGIQIYGGSLVEGYIDGKLIGRTDPNKGLFAVWDVSTYQGREVTLQVHSPSDWINRFDIIGFTSVPEPSTAAMLALGLGLIGWHAWRRN